MNPKDKLIELLERCEAYFDRKADGVNEDGALVPNEEMVLYYAVKDGLDLIEECF